MNIVLITSAMEPYAGRGTEAQVASALPKALRAQDHEVSVVLPLFKGIDPAKHSLARRLTKLTVEVNGEEWACEQWTGRTVSGVETVFIGHEELFHGASALEDGDESRIALRAGVFARAVASLLEKNEQQWEVVHAHGWLGAATLSAASELSVELPSILTIHDPRATGPSLEADVIPGVGSEGTLAAGARCAEVVTVDAPSLVASVKESLMGALGAREVRGIVNGIDAALWNPLTDPLLPARFDPVDLRGKARCKSAIQRELGLPVRGDLPLLMVWAVPSTSSAEEVEPWRRFIKVVARLMRNDIQVVCVGAPTGEAQLNEALAEFQDRWPDRFQVRPAAKALEHHALGAADLALTLSDHAPAPTPALIAQRYGAVPVAPAVGAMLDSVVDCDAKLRSGTGFLYAPRDEDALLATLRRALAATQLGNDFVELQRRVMRLDSSWERSARLHSMLYSRARGTGDEEEEDATASLGRT